MLVVAHRALPGTVPEQGADSGVVGGLDSGDGVDADAFVGAVQAEVVDAETGGGGDAQPGEVVADVGRSGDLRRHLDPNHPGGVDDGGAQPGVVRQDAGEPAACDTHLGMGGVGLRYG